MDEAGFICISRCLDPLPGTARGFLMVIPKTDFLETKQILRSF